MADIGTKTLERDTIQRHLENLGCVRFNQQSQEVSWPNGSVNGHRHIHILAVPEGHTASRAEKGTPTLPAVTLVVGAGRKGQPTEVAGKSTARSFLLQRQQGARNDTLTQLRSLFRERSQPKCTS